MFDEGKQNVIFYYEGYFFAGLYNGNGILIKDAHIPTKRVQEIHENEGMNDYLLESI